MAGNIGMALELFTYTLLLGATVYTVVQYKHNRTHHRSAREEALTMLNRMLAREQTLFNQINLLEENATRYFNTLNEAGLPEALKIKNELLTANEDIKNLIDNGRYQDAYILITFIDNPTTKPTLQHLELTHAKLPQLLDWKIRANRHITNCIAELGIITAEMPTSEEQEDMRRKTLNSLKQLRELISKEQHQVLVSSDW
jgi:hypothetical protein